MVKIKTASMSCPGFFDEIKEIKRAFKNADRIKAGKLKGRPAEGFLNEI